MLISIAKRKSQLSTVFICGKRCLSTLVFGHEDKTVTDLNHEDSTRRSLLISSLHHVSLNFDQYTGVRIIKLNRKADFLLFY